MTVRTYKSTDASAPSLTGQAGSLTTLLDAVLVNGYGSSTAAGWTIGQTTTNKRQYIMGAGSGFSVWVDDAAPTTAKEARVTGFETMSGNGVGTGPFPTNAQVAIGTTPNSAVVWRKSTTADATARPWVIVADNTCFYLFVETGDNTAPLTVFSAMFGDFYSYSASDVWNCAIIGRIIENSAAMGPTNGGSGTGGAFRQVGLYDAFAQLTQVDLTFMSNTLVGHFTARQFTGVGGSTAFGKHSDQAALGGNSIQATVLYPTQQFGYQGTWSNGNGGNSGGTWANQFAYPNAADGGLYFAPIWVNQAGGRRGYFKGLWCPLQHHPLTHGDTFSGTGNMSGKSFLAQDCFGASNWVNGVAPAVAAAQVFVETSNTWS